jgi:aminopeptidase N
MVRRVVGALLGAMTLPALRGRVGDEAFSRILRSWFEQQRGRAVTTPQFVALAEQVSGQDLTAFFDEWLSTPARPASLG